MGTDLHLSDASDSIDAIKSPLVYPEENAMGAAAALAADNSAMPNHHLKSDKIAPPIKIIDSKSNQVCDNGNASSSLFMKMVLLFLHLITFMTN